MIFNVKNLIEHDAFGPTPAEYFQQTGEQVDSVGVNFHRALGKLADVGSKRVLELERTIGVAALAGMFGSKRAIPAVVHFLQTTTAVATASVSGSHVDTLFAPSRIRRGLHVEA